MSKRFLLVTIEVKLLDFITEVRVLVKAARWTERKKEHQSLYEADRKNDAQIFGAKRFLERKIPDLLKTS